MSQPLNFGPDKQDPLAVPLNNTEQLIKLFVDGARPKGQELIGIEYEMFAHDRANKKPLSFDGQTSIRSLYFHMANKSDKDDPWSPIMEGSHLVALSSKRATLALEPGGQIEIAMNAGPDLKSVNENFLSVLRELSKNAQEQNIDLFAVGTHPFALREDMAFVIKKRYAIMRAYMARLGELGLDMMMRTCSIQLNIDYNDERDLVEKTRLGAYLMPFFALLCSSSAYFNNKLTKRALERAYIWQKTDPDRTGFPAIIFADDFSYIKWIEYALDVPMYFIRRGDSYSEVTGVTFREFMKHGINGEQALVRDFVDHLTIIFSEIRLKPYLELRSCDSLPGVYVTALSALTWALFYDDLAFTKTKDLFLDMNHAELEALQADIRDNGRSAKFRGQPVFQIISSLLNIARVSLSKINAEHYLNPFISLVSNNTTVVELLRSRFPVLSAQNAEAFFKSVSPLAPPLI